MSELKERGKRFLLRIGRTPNRCDVVGCGGDNIEVVRIKPLDPIDHDETLLALCEHHQEWAQERNELASRVHDELEAKRRELGDDYFEEVQRLAMPQDGRLREDILEGDATEPHIPLGEAFESDQA